MIKILTSSIIVLIICSSCSKSKIELESFDYTTYDYPIRIGVDGINSFYVLTKDYDNSDSIFHYYDYQRNRLISIDFYNQEIIKHTSIKDDKYPILGVDELISVENGFVIRDQNRLYKVDFNGQITERIEPIDFDYVKLHDGREPGIRSQYIGGGLTNNNEFDFIYSFQPSIRSTKLDYLNQPVLTKGYFNEKRVENSKEGFPYLEFLEEGLTFGHRLGARLLLKGDSVIVDFKFTPNIFIYSIDSLDLINQIKYDEIYEGLETNKPISTAYYQENYLSNFNAANLSDQRLYKQMQYDEYKDRYFRIVSDPLEKGNYYSLLIFNSNLEIEGKISLGKDYIPRLFIMPDGIYIRKLYQRESYIDLVKLDIDKDIN